MRSKFQKLADQVPSHAKNIVQEWGKVSVNILERMSETEQKILLRSQLALQEDSRNKTRDTYYFHTDGNGYAQDCHYNIGPFGLKKEYRSEHRLLWIQHGPRTAFMSNDDHKKHSAEIDTGSLKSVFNIYSACPWTMTLLSHDPWPHEPVYHSTASHESLDHTFRQKRLLWDIGVTHYRGFNVQDHRKWLDGLIPPPLFNF